MRLPTHNAHLSPNRNIVSQGRRIKCLECFQSNESNPQSKDLTTLGHILNALKMLKPSYSSRSADTLNHMNSNLTAKGHLKIENDRT